MYEKKKNDDNQNKWSSAKIFFMKKHNNLFTEFNQKIYYGRESSPLILYTFKSCYKR